MKKFLFTLALAGTLMSTVPAAFAQYPYPPLPPYSPTNSAYLNRQHVDVYGTVQNVAGAYLSVTSPQGTFTFILDRNITYRDLRHLRIGLPVRVRGHLRSTGQLLADHVDLWRPRRY